MMVIGLLSPSTGALPGAWFLLVMVGGWMLRPRRHALRFAVAPGGLVEHSGVADTERHGRTRRWLSAVPVVVLVLVDLRLGLGALVVAILGPTLRERRRVADRDQLVRTELPEVVDFLLAALRAGLSVRAAVAATAVWLTGPIPEAFAQIGRRVELGAPLADELDQLPLRLGEVARPVGRVLVAAVRYGTPVIPALERVADAARLDRRRHIETEARRVPVKLLFPLVACVLPAFALLTVVPVLVGHLLSLDL